MLLTPTACRRRLVMVQPVDKTFSMSDVSADVLARAKDDLVRDGFTVVPNVLPATTADAISDRVLTQARAERTQLLDRGYPAEAEGDDINQWVYQLFNKGEILHQLPLHPIAHALAGHLLGSTFLLSAFDAHITFAGNKLMPLHADQWWMPQPQVPGQDFTRQGDIERAHASSGDPTPSTKPITGPLITNVMWMMTDFTRENGATRFVPQTHLTGRIPDSARSYDEVVAEGPAGSIVAWDGRTWHAAGLNVTDKPRVGITTYFCGPMVRQLSNGTYGLRSDVRDNMPAELLALLGHAPFSSYGMTDDPDATEVRSGDQTSGLLE